MPGTVGAQPESRLRRTCELAESCRAGRPEWRGRRDLAAPHPLGSWSTKTWCGQLTAAPRSRSRKRFVAATVIMLAKMDNGRGRSAGVRSLVPMLKGSRVPGTLTEEANQAQPTALGGGPIDVRLEGIVKRYGDVAAVDGVDLEI